MSTPPQFIMEDIMDKTPPHTPTPRKEEKTPDRLRRIVDAEIHRMDKKLIKNAEMRIEYEKIIKECHDKPDDCNNFKRTAAEIWLNTHPKHNETPPIPIPKVKPWYLRNGGKKSKKSKKFKKSKKQRKTRKKSKK